MTTPERREKCLREPFGKRASPGVACPPDANSGAAGNTVDQYGLKTLPREVVRLIQELESEDSKTEIQYKRMPLTVELQESCPP
jgi:hypothetical protein